ncbi:MAG: yceD [Francisellaceae bacterium]|nr:yceD [Francisellaceae bacterium]
MLSTLKQNTLDWIDPKNFAKKHGQVMEAIHLSNFDCLEGLIINNQGKLDFKLTADIDESGIVHLHGYIKTILQMVCQRCLKPFDKVIDSHFNLSPVKDEEEAKTLPEHYEATLMTEGKLSIKQLIEEELLLNLPIVPMHEVDVNCKPANVWTFKETDTSNSSEMSDKPNPFRVLKDLIVHT